MPVVAPFRLPSLTEAAQFTPKQVVDLAQEVVQLKQQVDWFKRQLFGQKSEKRLIEADARQLSLGEFDMPVATKPPIPTHEVTAHTRKAARTPTDGDADTLPFFDASRVPVEVIEVDHPAIEGLTPDQYEIVGHKDSYRLAQRPGSYVVLQYRRPVVKLRDSQTLSCPPAPVGVLDHSRADVSFLAGLLVDKFAYHLPLYRQHQRLIDAGFDLSRGWLTQLVQQAIALLEPIYTAQFDSIRQSRVKAMDETPIKAGQAGPGKLKQGYFWPVYGELDEICFPYFDSRRADCVQAALGLSATEGAVLLSDGYAAYARYAEQTGQTHAQCWAHTRRGFHEAQDAEPEGAASALALIGKLYQVEAQIREQQLKGEKKREARLQHAKPVAERFFAWIDERFADQGLLPNNPFTKALAYARERRWGLAVYLSDPDVPIDTNHLERALRAIPMGRKAWLFCWTELGARQVGIMQSLLVTCRLHGIDPHTYLVDVLQRVGSHPAADVTQLTPRQWKQHFAANPLRSDLSKYQE